MAARRSVPPQPPAFRPSLAEIPGASFFALPQSASVPGLSTAKELPDVVLYGVPTELGVTGRPGTSLGPRAVRSASFGYGGYSQTFGVDIWKEIGAVDGGDLPGEGELEEVTRAVEASARAGQVSGLIGGTQLVTLAALRGLVRAKRRPVAVLHLDAFHDLEARSLPSDRSVFRLALNGNLVRAAQFLQLGVRGPTRDNSEYQAALAAGFDVTHTDDIRWDIHSAVSQVRKFTASSGLYVSVDLSVLDPATAPGVTRPSPGGLSMWDVQQLLRALVGAELVGFDIVGLCPAYDTSGLAAGASVGILHEILAVLAESRRGTQQPRTSSKRGRGGRRSA